MINVAIFQALVPKYRTPIFNELSGSNSINLTVYSGDDFGSLKNDFSTASFCSRYSRVITINIFGLRLKWQRNTISTILTRRYDIIILPWDIHYINLPFALLFSRLTNVPVVLWGHGYSKTSSRTREIVRNFYGKRSSGVLLYSKTIAKNLITNAKFEKHKVYVAQNAIDSNEINSAIHYWKKNTQKLIQFQTEKNLDPHNTIIFVSRLESDNNIELMFPALSKLVAERPSSKLVLVGDGDYKSVLEALANKYSIAKSIIFTGAIYHEKELAPWMLSSSLFCYPSNIGLSIHHAFYYGLPVVTSNNIGSHNPEIELLKDGYNGLLYNDGCWEDMLSKWLSVLNNHKLKKELGKHALLTVCDKYTSRIMVDGFLNCISSVSGKRIG